MNDILVVRTQRRALANSRTTACESAGYDDWQGTYNTGCYQNLNASNPQYKDLTLGNWINRQWNWMLCNEP